MNHYNSNATTLEFLAELERSAGIPANLLIVAVTTGPNENRGTWVHPKVAINLAQWCSPKFAVAVSKWVRGWLTGEYPMAPSFHLPQTLPEALREYAAALEVNERLKLENAQVTEALESEVEQRQGAEACLREVSLAMKELLSRFATVNDSILLRDFFGATQHVLGLTKAVG
jgi:hypothetical protein